MASRRQRHEADLRGALRNDQSKGDNKDKGDGVKKNDDGESGESEAKTTPLRRSASTISWPVPWLLRGLALYRDRISTRDGDPKLPFIKQRDDLRPDDFGDDEVLPAAA